MERKILFSGPYLALVQRGRWQFATRTKGSGVVGIIATTPEGKLLLVEQHRIPVNARVIELPAGLTGDTHHAESVLEAANRELIEETGYSARSLQCIGRPGPSSAGLSDETIQLVLATDLVRVSAGGGVDENEDITVHEIDPNALLDWVSAQEARGAIIDPKVYSAPFFLEQHRRNRIPRKIGLYCGTFNPPHLGHLKVARAALCHVDELWVIPARQSPHKADAPIDGEHRARMLELLLGDVPRVRIDRREIEKSEPSYTGQTIREIQGEHPRAAISLIIGDDQLPDLGRWWEFEAWKDQVTFLIAPRRGHRISREDLQTVDLAIPADAINATEIRQLAASGKPFDHWTGESVAEYAVKHALYSSTSSNALEGS